MAFQEGAHEGAIRLQLQAALAQGQQLAAHESATDAAALQLLRHQGVIEVQPARDRLVLGEGHVAVDVQFEAVLFGVVDEVRIDSGVGHRGLYSLAFFSLITLYQLELELR